MTSLLARDDARAILFSVKSYVAAMAAYYVALSIGLPRPYWAVITAYIVSQPLSGVAASKALFRICGTLTGAAVAVLLVPTFANAPEVLSFALAAWLGLCTYLGTLDRTARGYAFLLAGYTASIIGFPSVGAPAGIFATATVRVEEILIGLTSASLVHAVLLPQTVTASLTRRVAATQAALLARMADILDRAGMGVRQHDDQKLAGDIAQIHQLAVHLPFDRARAAPPRRAVHALLDEFSTMLVLASAIEDRLAELGSDGIAFTPAIADLFADASVWIRAGVQSAAAAALAVRARDLAAAAPARDWRALIEQNCLARLAEAIEVLAVCAELVAHFEGGRARQLSGNASASIVRAARRPLHRDRVAALQGALTTSLAVLIGCIFWIATSWSDGATAVLISGVIGALFSGLDGAAAVLRKVFVGSCIGVFVAAVYAFAILPRITEFGVLVAALFPAFLIVGVIYADPKKGPFALGLLLTLPAVVGLNDRYDSNFAVFINGSIAQLFGTAAAAVAAALLHPDRSKRIVARLLASAWKDLCRMTEDGSSASRLDWSGLGVDRLALLDQRAKVDGRDRTAALTTMRSILRNGVAVHDLRGATVDAPPAVIDTVSGVLKGLRDHGRSAARDRSLSASRLVSSIDAALAVCLDEAGGQRATLALAGLRRNVSPAEQAPDLFRKSRADD